MFMKSEVLAIIKSKNNAQCVRVSMLHMHAQWFLSKIILFTQFSTNILQLEMSERTQCLLIRKELYQALLQTLQTTIKLPNNMHSVLSYVICMGGVLMQGEKGFIMGSGGGFLIGQFVSRVAEEKASLSAKRAAKDRLVSSARKSSHKPLKSNVFQKLIFSFFSISSEVRPVPLRK